MQKTYRDTAKIGELQFIFQHFVLNSCNFIFSKFFHFESYLHFTFSSDTFSEFYNCVAYWNTLKWSFRSEINILDQLAEKRECYFFSKDFRKCRAIVEKHSKIIYFLCFAEFSIEVAC